MFAKLSKSRSKGGYRNCSQLPSQGNQESHCINDTDTYNRSMGKLPFRNSLRTSETPPNAYIYEKSLSIPLENHEIPYVSPLCENSDSDIDDSVSFAESLFPITPPVFSELGRRSTESYFVSDSDYSPLTDPRGSKKSSSVYGRREHIENGRRSVDMGSKNSPGYLHVDDFSILPIGERGSLINEEYETWEASSKLDKDPEELNEGTRSWTASPMSEEEMIDVGSAVLPPYDDAEDEFLEEFEGYFDHLHVDNLRQDQYPKLQCQNLVYLDYASCPLFSKFQVEEHSRIILAEGPCLGYSFASSSLDNPLFNHVSETQHRLLRMLNTTSSNYSIIFTAGFQESFRLLAGSFPFQKGTPLLVCQDNHVGVRQVMQSAHRAGGRSALLPVTEEELCIHGDELHKLLRRQSKRNASNVGLFIYPAQSNVSGIKHSLKWIAEAQQNGWNVCLDVTTYLPSNRLDLSAHQPDFVVGSFQHIFGYPTGMGFLLVRRESFCIRRLPSEAIQFVRNMAADEGEHCHILCPTDNNMNPLQFAALNLGFIQLDRIGLSAIQKRVSALTQWLVQRLCTFRHKDDDSRYLLRVYGSPANEDRGSIVTFNVIDLSGTILPPHIVLKLAARCNIKLAVGNFNNPGLSYLLGEKPNERSKDVDITEGNWGFMAVRASFGAVSNFSDVYRLVQFLSRFRDEEYLTTEAMGFIEESNQLQ